MSKLRNLVVEARFPVAMKARGIASTREEPCFGSGEAVTTMLATSGTPQGVDARPMLPSNHSHYKF